MKKLLEKLNYKGSKRIAVINSDESFIVTVTMENNDLTIDREIDPRFPYNFIMIFVRNQAEVDIYTPIALHNLLCDGVLWFCYPKRSSGKYRSDISRDQGWNTLNDSGFHGIRLVSIDGNWSAMRFRNIRFIRSTSERFTK